MATTDILGSGPPGPRAAPEGKERVSVLYDPRIRAVAYQVLLVAVLGYLLYEAATNARANLRAQGGSFGFDFWNQVGGFDINQALIPFSRDSTYGQAFWVGLINTLVVAVIGIAIATVLGFLVGVARLSRNWIVARVATVYVETLRNLPLLLQLFFWYNAVLKPLPDVRNSIHLPGGIFINNRGMILPRPIVLDGFGWVVGAFLLGVLGTIAFTIYANRKQAASGQRPPVWIAALGFLIVLPLGVYLLTGAPLDFEVPTQSRFNLQGGLPIYPELVALILGLSTYTAAFIAEIVRAGILAVSHGQSEAAHALGLRNGQTLRLVVIPQAMRVIIPPLTSQYLNLTKNSSLAIAIGYPDLAQVFAGTVLNQTGKAIEVLSITMGVYLLISLLTSFGMNVYNSRKALVER